MSFQLPASWAKQVEKNETIQVLFFLVQIMVNNIPFVTETPVMGVESTSQKMKNVLHITLRCLSEYANIRQTFFTDKNAKN